MSVDRPCGRGRSGFTILELSIVLAIIGLIVGVIMIGRDLIHAAELRSVISDVDKFKTAVNTFRGKYNCLPGDCANATAFWGTDPGGCPTTPNNSVPKTATCNGDGNGHVSDDLIGDSLCERFRFWQQLANAALIPGMYSGAGAPIAVPACVESKGGLNIPKGKISNSVFTVHYISYEDAGPDHWGSAISSQYFEKNFISFSPNTATAAVDGSGIISPMDAYSIDSKIDDGHAGSGSVLAQELVFEGNDWGNCATPPNSWPADYAVTSTTIGCGLLFNGEF